MHQFSIRRPCLWCSEDLFIFECKHLFHSDHNANHTATHEYTTQHTT